MPELPSNSQTYVFGDFSLNVASRTLSKNGKSIHLAHRPFDILVDLIENNERVVSRNELLDKYWEGRYVYDDALRKAIASIRRGLEDLEKPPLYIETHYGTGFRFIGKLQDHSKRPSTLTDGLEFKGNSRAILTVAMIFATVLGVLGFVTFRRPSESVSASQTEYRTRSIAVLPLKNLTGDPKNEYLSDGITESIITELSRTQDLRVISRSSTFSLKGKDIGPAEIGRQLAVDSFLEGSIQSKADSLNVSVRLISTSDGRVLWTSQEFQRPLRSALELQQVISVSLANELGTPAFDRPQHPNTTSADAYYEYLKGRFEWNKRTGDGIKQSIVHYQRAIGLDPNYALAYSGLAESYVQGIWHVPFDGNLVLPKAMEASRMAIELDASSAEAHTALASVYSLYWNWPDTDSELRKAIELNPRYARAFHVQAFHFMLTGRYSESIESIDRAEELDPLNIMIRSDKAILLFAAGRTDEAFTQWRKAVEMDSDFAVTHEHLANTYQSLGNESAALDEFIKLYEIKESSISKRAAYRRKAEREGLAGIYSDQLRSLLAKRSRGEKVSSVSIAWLQAGLGRNDAALHSLEKAYQQHSPDILLIIDFHFAALRSNPAYLDLVGRLGLSLTRSG